MDGTHPTLHPKASPGTSVASSRADATYTIEDQKDTNSFVSLYNSRDPLNIQNCSFPFPSIVSRTVPPKDTVSLATMIAGDIQRPSLNTEPYDAISPETLRNALPGQVVIITGAGGGLGRGESVAFANAGAKLALIDIPKAAESLKATAEECQRLTKQVKTYFCNVMDAGESSKTIAKIEKDLGSIDVLVNNAGGWATFIACFVGYSLIDYRTIDRPFHMETFDQFWAMIDLNFKAVS